MPDEIDPLVKQLLDMVREESRQNAETVKEYSKQNSESTRTLINRFFALVAVLLVANGALSGANLAINFFGLEMSGTAPDRMNVTAVEEAPPVPAETVYIINENDTGEPKGYADDPIELYEEPP